MTEEAKVTYATVRTSEDGRGIESYDIECRFSDGQKFAAIQVDGEFPKLAQRICAALALSEPLWRPMTSAPKDGTVILALLMGSDIPYPIRWQDKELPEGSPPGWFVTWDNYRLTEMDGPLCWMRCPPADNGPGSLTTSPRFQELADIQTEAKPELIAAVCKATLMSKTTAELAVLAVLGTLDVLLHNKDATNCGERNGAD